MSMTQTGSQMSKTFYPSHPKMEKLKELILEHFEKCQTGIYFVNNIILTTDIFFKLCCKPEVLVSYLQQNVKKKILKMIYSQ